MLTLAKTPSATPPSSATLAASATTNPNAFSITEAVLVDPADTLWSILFYVTDPNTTTHCEEQWEWTDHNRYVAAPANWVCTSVMI